MARALSNLRILLTGASSGIGRALALELARHSVRILLVGRKSDALYEVADAVKAAGSMAEVFVGDVTREVDRDTMLAQIVKHFGGLDILINNAGVGASGHFADSNEAILRQVMEVNFFAPVELIRLALPLLTAGTTPLIVNIASMTGRRGIPAWPEYSASKMALCGITEAMRTEFARFDVETLLVVPGLTQTSLRDRLVNAKAKMTYDPNEGMTAEYVARKVVAAVAAGKREIVLGSEAKWILRLHRFTPRLLDWLVRRRVRKLHE